MTRHKLLKKRDEYDPLDRRTTLSEPVLFPAAGAALVARAPVFAAEDGRLTLAQLIPADKRLDPAWVKSLFERGAPTPSRYSVASICSASG